MTDAAVKRLIYVAPLAVFLVIAAFFYKGFDLNPRALPSMLTGQPVPPFDLPPIKGRGDKGFADTDLPGEVSLVNVFGSWCVACQVEHPFLMGLKERGLVPIHGIDWKETDPDAGPRWLKRFGDPYTLVGADPDSRAAIAFGVTGAPETFVVDRAGIVRYKHVGPIDAEDWEDTLWPVIRELRKE